MKKIIPQIILAVFLIMSNIAQAEAVPINRHISNKAPSFAVQHQIKGNNIYVECILTGISFRETDNSNQNVGKLIVWIDGKKSQEVASAAFILKNLPYGKHNVKLEVVNLKNEPYGLNKEFLVNLPR